MNTTKFSEAISEIDDKYYVEAANYQSVRKRAKWGVIAACLCIMIVGCFVVPNMTNGNHDHLEVMPAAYPYVMVNGCIYLIDPEGYALFELPDGYFMVGKIEGNASADMAQNWYSQGCKVGEAIYQSADTSEVFVYTTLFSGNGEYRYVRFILFDE